MDPERKEEYNKFGTTEDYTNFRYKRGYSDFKRFEFDPIQSFFTSESSNFNFQFNYEQEYIFRKQSITTK